MSLDQVAMPSWGQFAAETFHPIRAMPFMTKLFISLMVILILALILRCIYRRGYFSCLNKRRTPSYQPADDSELGGGVIENVTNELTKLRLQIKQTFYRSNPELRDEPKNVHFNHEIRVPILKRSKTRDDFADSNEQISKL